MNSNGIRINRYLAMCGFGARRNCEELVLSGKVTANGQEVKDLSFRVDTNADKIHVRGVEARPIQENIYILLNKPRGYVVSHRPFENSRTVFDLLPKFPKNLNYVGRLDEDSEGLLILTTNGEFINKMTHPRYGYGKIYLIIASRPLTADETRTFRNGVQLDDGEVTLPAQIEQLPGKSNCYRIILHEGKNRQIRRMMKAFGIGVIRLTRVAMGPVNLGNLETGAWRNLTENELRKIKRDLKLKEI